MKKIFVVLLLLVAGGVLAQIGVGGSSLPASKFSGPTAYKDADTGIIFYVESDGRHVVALDKDGKILWCRDPSVDAKLKPYRTEYPHINYIGRPQKELAEVEEGQGQRQVRRHQL